MMNTLPATISATVAPASRPIGPADLIDTYLAGLKPSTVRAYASDLRSFAEWFEAPDPAAAAQRLLADQGAANLAAHQWRADMLEAGLAPNSVNRRLAAIRGMVRLANTVGMVGWTLSVPSVKSESYRDTRGPGRGVVIDMVAHLAEKDTPKAARDGALLRLLYERGLRRAEAVALDLGDVDLDGRRVRVMGKGKREPRWLTVPTGTRDALADWITHRGDQPGPLFVSLDPARKGDGRLTGDAVARIVAKVGMAVGVRGITPHQLRHSGLTDILDRSGGDVRRARAWSRHSQVQTVMVYDDNRSDFGGEMADLIALPEM